MLFRPAFLWWPFFVVARTGRFPPWRHCFHWMAGMLESADLRNLYDQLRTSLNAINMK